MLRQKVIIHYKSSDPPNLPMTPKFSNKGSSMTPKNSGLAETLAILPVGFTVQYITLNTIKKKIIHTVQYNKIV